jgi:hypothetical protein
VEYFFSVDFIEKWQTLIGSALGPFLAIILSAFGFYLREVLRKKSERKEATRRAEIAFAQTLTHIFTSIDQLDFFVERIEGIISDIRKVTNPETRDFSLTNFPPMIDICFDEELLRFKFNSNYLHNKILITEHVIRWMNSTTTQLRNDFEGLIKRNMVMITLEKMKPLEQRISYAQNLESFAEMIKKFLQTFKANNIKSITQAKVYNLKLIKRPLITIWKYEGISFKFFKNKSDMDNYKGSLEAIDRIDALMDKEAISLIAEMNERTKKNSVKT